MREFDGSARQTTEHVSELSPDSPACVRGRLRLKLFYPRRQYTSSNRDQAAMIPQGRLCDLSALGGEISFARGASILPLAQGGPQHSHKESLCSL